jgi:hypothetical protein
MAENKPLDLPRAELQQRAEEALRRYPGAQVYFKFTCVHCGERCTLTEPNVLYEKAECFKCGHETVITKGGFSLHINVAANRQLRQD